MSVNRGSYINCATNLDFLKHLLVEDIYALRHGIRREFSSFCLYFINTISPSLTPEEKAKGKEERKKETRQLNNRIRIN